MKNNAINVKSRSFVENLPGVHMFTSFDPKSNLQKQKGRRDHHNKSSIEWYVLVPVTAMQLSQEIYLYIKKLRRACFKKISPPSLISESTNKMLYHIK